METTELAVKASRRPLAKGGQSGRAPSNQNRGRGQWSGRGRGRFRGGRSMSSGGRTSGGGRGGRAGGSSGSVNFDPLACYHCGVHGHMARDCPQATQSQGSGNAMPSRGGFSKSGQKGPKSRGRGRSVRFSALKFCMTTRVMPTPLMIQGNFMCHWSLHMRWTRLLRRKFKMKEKTKKVLCQCGS